MKNTNVQQGVRMVTIAGSSILILGAGMTLLTSKDVKSAIMPLVSILVCISAFRYAVNDKPLTINAVSTEE
jgi:VIT1/CCC1 family predicted Fe2+/Mn2+ transporter